MQHAYKTGLLIPLKGEQSPCAKLNKEQVKEIRKLYNPKQYSLTQLAGQFNISRGQIYRIVKNLRWQHI
jgi:DNA invertase Pin-like site-specific DNA recombinase